MKEANDGYMYARSNKRVLDFVRKRVREKC